MLGQALDWLNVERVGVIVAVATAAVAAWYAHRQTRIAKEAQGDARRAADAAEQQVAIAEAAKEEARRAADAASDTANMEARRDHLNGAVKDIELLRVELRQQHRALQHPDQFAVFRNNGHRTYSYQLLIEYNPTSHGPVGTGRIQPGETIDLYLAPHETSYKGIVMWLDGECPCGRPDGDQGHWRAFWQTPGPERVEAPEPTSSNQ